MGNSIILQGLEHNFETQLLTKLDPKPFDARGPTCIGRLRAQLRPSTFWNNKRLGITKDSCSILFLINILLNTPSENPKNEFLNYMCNPCDYNLAFVHEQMSKQKFRGMKVRYIYIYIFFCVFHNQEMKIHKSNIHIQNQRP